MTIFGAHRNAQGQYPIENKPRAFSQSGNLSGKKVSLLHKAATILKTPATTIMGLCRRAVLKPAEDLVLILVKESRNVKIDERIHELETNLAGAPVSLKTSTGSFVQGMYFNASAERKAKAKDTFSPDCIPTANNQVPNPSEDGPTVLFFSGSDTSVFDKSYETTIQSYLERGINVMIMDYPGVGKSHGNFSVKNTYDAADAAFQFVKEKKVPNDKILAEGFSMGSAPASYIASKNQGVHLLLRNPFTKMSEIVREEVRKDSPGRFTKNIIAPGIQKLSQFALPFNNEKFLPHVTGHFGLLTAGKTDMYNEKLNTSNRLASAYNKNGSCEELGGG